MILRRSLFALVTVVAASTTTAQPTGQLTLLSTSGGGAGTITAVGDCVSGACFQNETAFTFFAASAIDGVATFRAITIADLPTELVTDIELSSAISSHAGIADSHHTWPLTDAEIPDSLTLAEGSVTAHEAALSITESQIVDLAHTVNTDDQTATEVPYTPTTGGDWPEGSPSEVAGALDTLAGRESGGANPAGSGSEIQYRSDATTFGAVTGSAVSGADVTLGGVLSIPAGSLSAPSLAFAGDPDTGIHQGTANRLRIVAGGALAAEFLSATNFGVMANHHRSPASGGAMAILHGTGLSLSSSSSLAWTVSAADGTVDLSLTRVGAGALAISGAVVNSPFSQTCASSGDANPGFLTVTVSGRTFVKLTNSDADGCTALLSETGAIDGQRLEVVNVSNAGGTIAFADSSGVQETGAGCSLAVWGSATFRYTTDRWVLVSCAPSN